MVKNVSKGKMTEDEKAKALSIMSSSTSVNDLKDVDLVIEAATENFEIKTKIFQELSTSVKPDAILASNTSSISITKIAAVTNRPEKVIGMHFVSFSVIQVMLCCTQD